MPTETESGSEPRLARAFIISRNLLITTLLREALAGAGHQIVGVGEEGFVTMDRVLAIRPQLVILDMVLVRSEGLATIEALHLIDPGMAVIVCSALLERRYAIEALRRGASGFVVKPFDRQTVVDAAQRAIGLAHGDRPPPPTADAAPAGAVTDQQQRSAAEEQRDFARIGLVLPIRVTPVDGEPIETVTSDVSGGGVLLAGGSLAPGSEVAFSLALADDEAPVEGRARVIRITGDGRPALQFEHVPIAEHERLIRYFALRESSA